jgi:murein DD-endopeptidase MepM/ murein hydrolase activator NlpD
MKWAKYLPEPYFSRITQGFAVPNPIYKVSGHHVGVDHGTQGAKDVPIFMPCDGRVTRIYKNDPVLGNCAVVLSSDNKWAFRLAHMKYPPTPGAYSAGTRIGTVGTTGLSTSEHLHIDAWKDGTIRMNQITSRESILKYCVDAHDLVIQNDKRI